MTLTIGSWGWPLAFTLFFYLAAHVEARRVIGKSGGGGGYFNLDGLVYLFNYLVATVFTLGAWLVWALVV